jgi:hypothetical protein
LDLSFTAGSSSFVNDGGGSEVGMSSSDALDAGTLLGGPDGDASGYFARPRSVHRDENLPQIYAGFASQRTAGPLRHAAGGGAKRSLGHGRRKRTLWRCPYIRGLVFKK